MQTTKSKSKADYYRKYRRSLNGRVSTAAYATRRRFPESETKPTKRQLDAILAAQDAVCALTGRPFTSISEISVDHLHAVSIIGEASINDLSNLVFARRGANSRKGKRTLAEYYASFAKPVWTENERYPAYAFRGKTKADVIAYFDALAQAKGRPIPEKIEIADDLLMYEEFLTRGEFVYGSTCRFEDGKLVFEEDYTTLMWRLNEHPTEVPA